MGAEEKALSLLHVHLSDHCHVSGALHSEETPVVNAGGRVLVRLERHFTNDQDLTVFPFHCRRNADRERTGRKRFWHLFPESYPCDKDPK